VKYSISIVVLNNLELTIKCLSSIEATARCDYELIISDNGSSDGTKEFLLELRHPNLKVITYPENTGFGFPHNRALKLAKGDYFVVLNNDIFVHEDNWLEKLSAAFDSNSNLAIVGFAGNQSYLNKDGTGDYSPNGEHDYVEASCLMMPRQLAQRYGLFSDDYELAYYEDADLSLRYRQMGFDIELVPAVYDHVRYSTSGAIDALLIQRVLSRNKEVFFQKWGIYFARRYFTRKVLVKSVSLDPLNHLHVTSILQHLKDELPLVEFSLMTNRTDIFAGHPAVSCFIGCEGVHDEKIYDRVLEFDFSQLGYSRPPVVTLAEQAGIRSRALSPVIYLNNGVDNCITGKLPLGKFAVIIPSSGDYQLHGEIKEALVGNVDALIELTGDQLGQEFYLNGECIGGFSELVAVISRCCRVIGPPGIIVQVAQALRIPALVLLTREQEPLSLGIDLTRASFVYYEELSSSEMAEMAEMAWDTGKRIFHLQDTAYRLYGDTNAMWEFCKKKMAVQKHPCHVVRETPVASKNILKRLKNLILPGGRKDA